MSERLFKGDSLRFARQIDELCYENPFGPRRLRLEAAALGRHFVETEDAWNLGPGHRNANLVPLGQRVQALLERIAPAISAEAHDEDLRLLGSLLRYGIYFEHNEAFIALAQKSREAGFNEQRVALFRQVQSSLRKRLNGDALTTKLFGSLEHLFATMFQIRRAFENIFETIVGRSKPAQLLRATVWESVFTHDMRRYERSLYRNMQDTNTLVLGPSGTGKELVARAIGLSRYLPFDKRSLHFEDTVSDAFFALNVGALAETLVESELFGHKRGSFTGAIADHAGWFEVCPQHGTVFLDEIGEIGGPIQVKLLRVLQNREFQRVGDRKTRAFAGKIVAATNQDLHHRMQTGQFRQDLYYRLCSDVVETPSLSAQLQDAPDDLPRLVSHVARNIVEADEVAALTSTVCDFVERELGLDYPWPGNVRELAQCVRNIVVRGSYHAPAVARIPVTVANNRAGLGGLRSSLEADALGELVDGFVNASVPFERQFDIYVTLSYAHTGSYAATGRELGIDRRTVKTRVDEALLAKLRSRIDS